MSQARTERRAAERRAAKLARKAAQKSYPAAVSTSPLAACEAAPEEFNYAAPLAAAEPEPTPKPAISEARLAANRANAQKSTGPQTEAGKAVSRFNAVRNALTGPVGVRETNLVQAIADHDWRLARIPALEANIYALGEHKLAGDEMPAHLLEAHIQITYEKHFRNLHLQQNRLTRYRAKDLAELKALQQAREEEEKQNYERAAALQQHLESTGQSLQPEKFGFVFSTSDLAAFHEAKSDLRLAKLLIQLRSEGEKTLAQAA
jgi:uncharacterized protein with GYD domain